MHHYVGFLQIGSQIVGPELMYLCYYHTLHIVHNVGENDKENINPTNETIQKKRKVNYSFVLVP